MGVFSAARTMVSVLAAATKMPTGQAINTTKMRGTTATATKWYQTKKPTWWQRSRTFGLGRVLKSGILPMNGRAFVE